VPAYHGTETVDEARLVVENAKLREQYETVLADYRLEVAKLRELVHILCHCMQIHKDCDDCILNGAKGELAFDPLCACDGLHELLREVGVEVEQ
jgi:hypothetical protein